MTILSTDRAASLRQALQAQADRHTDELAALTAHGVDAEHNGMDRLTVAALIDSTRQALADTTEALKRVADGTYGRCERCDADIPVERLEILPHARWRVPCQRSRRG
jgi:RNA polymerase-binding transcription factor DksA